MREIKTGILVVLSCALLFVGLWLAGSSSTSIGTQKNYKVRFRNLALLPGKAKVAYGGVAVGQISRVHRLSPAAEDGTVAEADIEIDPSVVLRQGDRVVITSQGIIGEKYLDIEPGPEDAPVLEEEGVLVGGFGGFGGVLANAEDLVPALGEAVLEARALAGELRSTVSKVDGFLDVVQGTVEENRSGIQAAVQQAHDSLAEVEEILEENRETIRSAMTQIESRAREAEPMIADATALVAETREKFGSVLGSLQDLSARLEAFVDEIEGMLAVSDPKLMETLDQLRVTARNLADASAQVRGDPSVLIWGVDEEDRPPASTAPRTAEARAWMGPHEERP